MRHRRVLVAAAAVLALVGCGSGEGEQATGSATVEQQPVLEPWFDAARGSAEEPANVVVLGDSVSEGFGLHAHLERRWIDQLQRGLRAELTPGCATTPGGWHGTTSLVPAAYRGTSLPDPATSGSVTDVLDAGPGGRGLSLAPGASVTWTVDARQVDLGYRTRPGRGVLRVEVDGSTAKGSAQLATAAADHGRRQVWSSTDLGAGSHRVVARNVSRPGGGAVSVTDLRPYRDDRERCVHVLDASRSGVSLRFITEKPDYLADTLALDPDVLVVPLGFNDARSGQTPADFRRSLGRLSAQVRAAGYDGPVLLVGLFEPPPGTFAHDWSGYLAAMRATASTETGVSFLDLSTALPEVRGAPRGTYLDALHPDDGGMDLLAEAMLDALTPRPTPDVPSGSTTAPSGSSPAAG